MKGLCYEVQGISHTCNCSVIKLYNSAVIKHSSKKKPWVLSLLQHYTDVFFIKLHKSFLPAISIPTCRHLANQNLGKLKKRTQHFSEPQSFLLSILFVNCFPLFLLSAQEHFVISLVGNVETQRLLGSPSVSLYLKTLKDPFFSVLTEQSLWVIK